MKDYELIFDKYKEYLQSNSKYSPNVVKYNSNAISMFPTVVCTLSNWIETDNATIDKIEYYDQYYFTINIYTKDKTKGSNIVTASQVISEELSELTTQFFGNVLNMKRTRHSPEPNLDTSILRVVIQYQCLIGNARKNIIRR